ncbi:hypothetical protein [Kitasatospora mediocidica]|uniref:hypothetical protein n=1 Tax=Kitasatospora mediocidica TaxID=58352 RepID=UPI00055A94A1|nr:hypothetical protein [Kitasatospora mediocidica]
MLAEDPAVQATVDAYLSRSAAPAPSAKQFLASWGATPVIGGSLLRGAERGRSRWLGRGVGVNRSAGAEFDRPVGEVIVGALCSLARTGRPLKS